MLTCTTPFNHDSYQYTTTNGENRLICYRSLKKRIKIKFLKSKMCKGTKFHFIMRYQNLGRFVPPFWIEWSLMLFNPSWFFLSRTYKMSYYKRGGCFICNFQVAQPPSPSLLKSIYFQFFKESSTFVNNEWCNLFSSICYAL